MEKSKVAVVACGITCLTDIGYDLTLADVLTGADGKAAAVTVKRVCAVAMVNHKVNTIARSVVFGIEYRTGF